MSIAYVEAVTVNGADMSLVSSFAIFINGLADLFNNPPRNPPNRVILDGCTLLSFMSTDILL